MSDYYSTADAMQDWCDARLDADLEQAQWEREARESRAEQARTGVCPHNTAGVGYREVAFYPEQIGLSPGQTHCFGCNEAYASEIRCFMCDSSEWHCGGVNGWASDHTAFVTPPMVRVCSTTEP